MILYHRCFIAAAIIIIKITMQAISFAIITTCNKDSHAKIFSRNVLGYALQIFAIPWDTSSYL